MVHKTREEEEYLPTAVGDDQETLRAVDQSRQQCDLMISEGFLSEETVLIDALPAMGKSSGVIRWASQTNSPLTVFAPRHELFDQYEQWADESGLTSVRIPSLHHDCPTVNGEGMGNTGVATEIRAAYQSGLSGPEIHREAQELFGVSLPCQQAGRCPYMAARDFDVEEPDVLIGHYKQAYEQRYSKGRYVAIDECPESAFVLEFAGDEVRTAVTQFLQQHEELPFVNYRDLDRNASHPEKKAQATDWFEEHYAGEFRDVNGLIEQGTRGHALAPLLTYARLISKILDNSWWRAILPAGEIVVENRSGSEFKLLIPPDLTGAESIVALDGTPVIEKWELLLGEDINHQQVLDDQERHHYLREGLGLRLIQTDENMKPYASYVSHTPEKDLTLVEEGQRLILSDGALISTRKAICRYKNEGLDDLVADTMYYGGLKGSNEFAEYRLGFIIGSPHYGDQYIEMWGALAGKAVERTDGSMGTSLDYGPFGNKILQGMREHSVLQAAMRFGRKESNGEKGATVFLHTCAIPEWVPVTKSIPKITTWNSHKGGIKQVIETLRGMDRARTKEVATAIEAAYNDPISVRQVRDRLKVLAEFGYVEEEMVGGDYVWQDVALETAPEHGHVSWPGPTPRDVPFPTLPSDGSDQARAT